MMPVAENIDIRGQLRVAEPMDRHTTWRVGGPADRWYQPADLGDLALFLKDLPPDEPVTWIGLGSNVLVRDGGIRGTVISTFGALDDIRQHADGQIIAGAGVACAKVARYCSNHGFSGGEFLAGIPGSVGGALAMNAGAFGSETWRWVEAVETVDRSGNLHFRQPAEYEVGYRHVAGPAGEWFVAAHFRFDAVHEVGGKARIRALLDRRSQTQPTGQASCGSVFRNPEGDHAARLIEAAGLKGYRLGGAQVSTKHANFIINESNASAADIEQLILLVQQKVEDMHGIRLQPEVRIIGEAAGKGV